MAARRPAAGPSYPPLSSKQFSPGIGMDLCVVGLALAGTASLIGAVNFIVTITRMRAPGMTWMRMPLFAGRIYTMRSCPARHADPDRRHGDAAGRPQPRHAVLRGAGGRDPVLWQHLFWFYSHPACTSSSLPAMGVIPRCCRCSRAPAVRYTAMVISTIAIGVLGITTWSHQMFTDGLPTQLESNLRLLDDDNRRSRRR